MSERILCVLGKINSGGVESIMCSYYRFLDKSQFQYDFIYEEGSAFDIPADLLEMGARAFKVSSVSNPIKYVKDVKRIIKKGNYRIVHSNLNALSLFSLFAAKICGVKYRILHNHTTSSPVEKKRTFLKKLLRPFNLWFTNVPCACSDLASRWMYGNKKTDLGKVTILRNGVDTEKFAFSSDHRSEIRKEYNIRNQKVIGHIGRFMTQKNHFFIIDIFEAYLQKDPTAILMLVGDGELFLKVQSYAKEKGIYDNIVFTGVRHDIEKLYSAFDIFILPSLYEGLPVVGMEACACGLPVVFSSEITRECAVTDNVYFLPINDCSLWVEKISALAVADRESTKGHMSGHEYDIRICAKELEKLYRKCI